MKKKILISVVIIVIVAGAFWGFTNRKNKTDELLEIAKQQLESKEYEDANDSFDSILLKDPNNDEVKRLKEITESLIRAKEDFNKGEFDNALDNIDRAKSTMDIEPLKKDKEKLDQSVEVLKQDTEILKSEINDSKESLDKIKEDLSKVKGLINEKKLEEANKILSDIRENSKKHDLDNYIKDNSNIEDVSEKVSNKVKEIDNILNKIKK